MALFIVPLLLAEHFADVLLSSMQASGARANLLAVQSNCIEVFSAALYT